MGWLHFLQVTLKLLIDRLYAALLCCCPAVFYIPIHAPACPGIPAALQCLLYLYQHCRVHVMFLFTFQPGYSCCAAIKCCSSCSLSRSIFQSHSTTYWVLWPLCKLVCQLVMSCSAHAYVWPFVHVARHMCTDIFPSHIDYAQGHPGKFYATVCWL